MERIHVNKSARLGETGKLRMPEIKFAVTGTSGAQNQDDMIFLPITQTTSLRRARLDSSVSQPSTYSLSQLDLLYLFACVQIMNAKCPSVSETYSSIW